MRPVREEDRGRAMDSDGGRERAVRQVLEEYVSAEGASPSRFPLSRAFVCASLPEPSAASAVIAAARVRRLGLRHRPGHRD